MFLFFSHVSCAPCCHSHEVSHCAGMLQIKLREEIQDEEGQGEGLQSAFFKDEICDQREDTKGLPL